MVHGFTSAPILLTQKPSNAMATNIVYYILYILTNLTNQHPRVQKVWRPRDFLICEVPADGVGVLAVLRHSGNMSGRIRVGIRVIIRVGLMVVILSGLGSVLGPVPA